MNSNNSQLTIAIDAGGTEIKAGLLRGSEILASRRWSTERELGPEHAVERILQVAREMYSEFPDASAIGLVVPGVVNTKDGIAEYSENICWKNIPFVELIQNLTKLPVGFAHDVRAGGLAESRYGAGRGYNNSLFMAIGTGISAAIIIEGKLVEGPYLGEIGHLDVKSGIPCACESFGCLETVSTGPSIIRAYNELSPKKLANAKEVFEASLAGDSIAAAVWADAVEAIAFALTACVNLLSPEIIIIGGGVSKAGDALLAPIKKHFEKRLTFQPHPRLAIAELGDLAGMIGAGIAAEKALTR